MSKSSIFDIEKAISVVKIKIGKKISDTSFIFFLVFFLHFSGLTFFGAGVIVPF